MDALLEQGQSVPIPAGATIDDAPSAMSAPTPSATVPANPRPAAKPVSKSVPIPADAKVDEFEFNPKGPLYRPQLNPKREEYNSYDPEQFNKPVPESDRGVAAGASRLGSQVVKLPGAVKDAFMTPPRDDDEKKIFEKAQTTYKGDKADAQFVLGDRKSTRLNSSHG